MLNNRYFMSQSLYQKYRPQQFSDVIGQSHVTDTIKSELRAGAVSHAYLFSGPRGVGKTSISRLLARAVNCLEQKEGEPCNTCKNCQTIIDGKTLDVIEMDAASHTGVDNVRENIIEQSRVAPSFLEWKVFIIDEVHMLSTSAFNALLKTLEEPPAKTLFILATTELHKIPETIVSRCERFQFKRLSSNDIVERLEMIARKEEVVVDREVLQSIAKRCGGAARDAESLLGQVLTLHESHVTADVASVVLPPTYTEEMIQLLRVIIEGKTAEGIAQVNGLLQQGIAFRPFVEDMVEFLRAVMLYSVNQQVSVFDTFDIDAESLAWVQKCVQATNTWHISEMISRFMDAKEQLASAPIVQLPLEMAIVELTLQVGHSVQAGSVVAPQRFAPVSETKPATVPAEQVQTVVKEPEQKEESPEVLAVQTEETKSQPQEPEVTVISKAEPGEQPPPEAISTFTPTSEQPVVQEAAAVEPAAPNPAPVTSAPEAQPAEQAIEEPSQPTTGGSITIDSVKKQWGAVVAAAQEKNHALQLPLRVAHLVEVRNGNTVVLGFQYSFYTERLDDPKNREVVGEALETVFGMKVLLDTVVDEQYSADSTEEVVGDNNIEELDDEEIANVWDLATQTFGE